MFSRPDAAPGSATPAESGLAPTPGSTAPAHAGGRMAPALTAAKGSMVAVIALALAAVASTLYLSPTAGSQRPHALAPIPSRTPTAERALSSPIDSATSPTPQLTSPRTVHSKAPGQTTVIYRVVQGPTIVQRQVLVSPATQRPKHLYCTDFRYQQDAQAAYVANLSDPWGLDGAPGAHNGDGLACSQLPVDPSRAASVAVDPFVPPTPASKSFLSLPVRKYFGIAEDGLPGDTPLFNRLAAQVGKAPSEVSWFSTFDETYNADKVVGAWSHGSLPMITWMSVSGGPDSTTAGSYTLSNIVAGKLDTYLLAYAGSILRTGLPVVLRFDHEMNGNWFPWSAGFKANVGVSGQPNLYVQAWQHIWNVFNSVGANADVIWLWSPVRIDNINPHSTLTGFKYETSLAEDYPGDQYVDWVGMTAYEYKPTDGWTYEGTFRKTLDALKALCSKPIFVSELGATEAVGSVAYSAQKAQWTAQTLAGLAAEPGVVGFSWFNNTVNDVHRVDGLPIQTDWQFSSSPAALAAFKAAVSSPLYASGVMPDNPR